MLESQHLQLSKNMVDGRRFGIKFKIKLWKE